MGPIVEIIVKGDVGAGKTTISQLIEKALRAESLSNYTVVDDEWDSMPKLETFSRRIEAMKEKNVDIRVKVEQTSRSLLKSQKENDE